MLGRAEHPRRAVPLGRYGVRHIRDIREPGDPILEHEDVVSRAALDQRCAGDERRCQHHRLDEKLDVLTCRKDARDEVVEKQEAEEESQGLHDLRPVEIDEPGIREFGEQDRGEEQPQRSVELCRT